MKIVSYIELPSGSDVFFTPVLMALSQTIPDRLRARTARISVAPWASWVASCSPRATCRPANRCPKSGNDPQTILFDCTSNCQNRIVGAYQNIFICSAQFQHVCKVLCAMADYGLDPQAALDQPRFCLQGTGSRLQEVRRVQQSRIV